MCFCCSLRVIPPKPQKGSITVLKNLLMPQKQQLVSALGMCAVIDSTPRLWRIVSNCVYRLIIVLH